MQRKLLIVKKITYDEETYLLDSIERIEKKVNENNKMLRSIIKVLNYYLANAKNENEQDFGRNILTNMISNMIDIGKFKRIQ